MIYKNVPFSVTTIADFSGTVHLFQPHMAILLLCIDHPFMDYHLHQLHTRV